MGLFKRILGIENNKKAIDSIVLGNDFAVASSVILFATAFQKEYIEEFLVMWNTEIKQRYPNMSHEYIDYYTTTLYNIMLSFKRPDEKDSFQTVGSC